jgi:acetylornithine/succinyldiaminopimelate/putrescine aminotransferase
VQKLGGSSIDLCDLFQPGSHGTTFGGTPLACATSMAVLETIEKEHLISNARVLGEYAISRLQKMPGVGAVRGMGLMLGIELDNKFKKADPKMPSRAVVTALMRNGLLSVPAGPMVIRWLPPLNVSKAEVDEALTILERTLGELAGAD